MFPGKNQNSCDLRNFIPYRYDGSGADLVATGSADGTVKVWDTTNAILRATLHGGTSNVILACDISNGVVVAGGSDKTCRVWNVRTERMVSQAIRAAMNHSLLLP